jgi:hypothetical protein
MAGSTAAHAQCDPADQAVTNDLYYPGFSCLDAEADAYSTPQSVFYQSACVEEFPVDFPALGVYPFDDWYSVENVDCSIHPIVGDAVVEVTVCCFDSGPSLTLTGTCTAGLDVNLTGFTPFGNVAVMRGFGAGADAVAGGACGGTTTGLSSLSMMMTLVADANGEISLSPTVGAQACVAWVQMMDETTCDLTDAMPLP